MYLEALYEMDDEDMYLAFFDEDMDDFFSFESDFYIEDDSYYYDSDSNYYGDDSYLDEHDTGSYNEEKVHIFDEDLIDEERVFVEKDFHIM